MAKKDDCFKKDLKANDKEIRLSKLTGLCREWQKSSFIQPAIVLIAFARKRCCVQRTWSLKKSTSPMTQHREPKCSVCPPGEPYRKSVSRRILAVAMTRTVALAPSDNWIGCWGGRQRLVELGRAKQCWASLEAAVWLG